MGGFDRLFWRRLWRIGKPVWISDQRWFPLGLLVATLLLTGSLKSANVVVSYVNRDMMTALADRNSTVFFHNVLLIVAYSLVAAPIMAVDGYVQGRLMIRPGGRLLIRDGDGERGGRAHWTRFVEGVVTRFGWNRGPMVRFRPVREIVAELEQLGFRVRVHQAEGRLYPGNVLLVAERPKAQGDRVSE